MPGLPRRGSLPGLHLSGPGHPGQRGQGFGSGGHSAFAGATQDLQQRAQPARLAAPPDAEEEPRQYSQLQHTSLHLYLFIALPVPARRVLSDLREGGGGGAC